MSRALYRTYRSRSLDEIVGQSHITRILQRAIARGHIAHAYLLTGPRGVGKTSIARILAHEINGLPYTDESTHLDIIEIDAASNNSVEDIRDLRDKVQIAPTSSPKKIYIIDEVHMLSKSAFNALLKTLEEPPEHVVFILATTDADKLPATILSRVQRFNFRAISPCDAAKHLAFIAEQEKIAITPDALELIAEQGKGSFRDSISLLDQLRSLSDETIDRAMVAEVLGLAQDELVEGLLAAYATADIGRAAQLIDEAEAAGTPAELLAEQLLGIARQRVVEDAALLPLLDKLLAVPRAGWPRIALLTALASRTAPSVTAPAPHRQPSPATVSEPVAPYTHSPAAPSPQTPPVAPSSDPHCQGTNGAAASAGQSGTPSASAADLKQPSVSSANDKTSAASSTPIDFPWEQFLDAVGAVGARTYLTKAGHAFDGQTLTIYAGKKFAKMQIDRTLPTLSAALNRLGITAEIAILATSKPPKDRQKATILAMMGGGEEITIDG
ncbi:MAG: DNA polymerase III subunit gamma/tau [Candidatus Saccharibacteria bacterium]|nr:DNA polymerase III subunit gamma/tau [Candidatus Saccharibacteria bacterium]